MKDDPNKSVKRRWGAANALFIIFVALAASGNLVWPWWVTVPVLVALGIFEILAGKLD